MPFQYALTRKYSHPYEKILITMRKSSHYDENFFSS